MNNEFLNFNLAEARDKLRKSEIGAVELTESYVEAVEALRPLNAFITETPDKAMEMAKRSEARLATDDAGPMEGIPIGMKDLFCTENVLTTAASHILSLIHI